MRRNVQPGFFVQELRARRKSFDGHLTLAGRDPRIRIIVQNASEPLLAILATLFSPPDLIAISRGNQSLRITGAQHPERVARRLPAAGLAVPHRCRVPGHAGRGAADARHTRAPAEPLRTCSRSKSTWPPRSGSTRRSLASSGVIPDDHYVGETFIDFYQRPQLLIFGLGDPRSVESEMRRLKLVLRKPEYIRGWIAHTEDTALDFVRDSILTITNKEECAALIEVLARVKSPRTAGPMLELMLGVEGARDRPRAGSKSIPATPSPDSSPSPPARASWPTRPWSTSAPRSGRVTRAFIRECLASAPPGGRREGPARGLEHAEDRRSPSSTPTTTPEWLRSACDDAKKLKPPAWVAAGRPAADPRRWPQAERRAGEGRAGGRWPGARSMRPIRSSPPSRPTPTAGRSTPSPGRSSSAGWPRARRRRRSGPWARSACSAPTTRRLKLTPLIRAWPGESQHPRAVFGLECLRAIGTDVALMQLNGIAQKLLVQGAQGQGRRDHGGDRQGPRPHPRRAGGPHRPRLRPRRARQPRLRLRPAPVPVRPRPRDEADGPRRGRQAQATTCPSPAPRTTRPGPRPPSRTGSCSRSRSARWPRSRPSGSSRRWSPAAAGARPTSRRCWSGTRS